MRLVADALEIGPGAIHPEQRLTYSVLIDGKEHVEHISPLLNIKPRQVATGHMTPSLEQMMAMSARLERIARERLRRALAVGVVVLLIAIGATLIVEFLNAASTEQPTTPAPATITTTVSVTPSPAVTTTPPPTQR